MTLVPFGRHASTDRGVRLPLPLHVVVTLVSFVNRWGSARRGRMPMRCPFCRHSDCRVIDSREVDDGQATRRRRSCAACGRRFTTVEEAGARRRQAQRCHRAVQPGEGRQRGPPGLPGAPVDEDALQQLAHRVEEAVRAGGTAEIPSHEVGLAILGPLRELDEVAYLRFASVYRSFSSIEDFEKEIADLRRPPGATRPADRPTTAITRPARHLPVGGPACPRHGTSGARGTRTISPGPPPGTGRLRAPPEPAAPHQARTGDPSPPLCAQGEGEHDRDRRRRIRTRQEEQREGREAGAGSPSSGSTPPPACTRTTRSPGSAATSS